MSDCEILKWCSDCRIQICWSVSTFIWKWSDPTYYICVGGCSSNIGISHYVCWWHGFPTQKHEKWRSIILLPWQSQCQVAEQTVYFSMTVHGLCVIAGWTRLSCSDALPWLWIWCCCFRVAVWLTQRTIWNHCQTLLVRPSQALPEQRCDL